MMVLRHDVVCRKREKKRLCLPGRNGEVPGRHVCAVWMRAPGRTGPPVWDFGMSENGGVVKQQQNIEEEMKNKMKHMVSDPHSV